MPPKKQQGPGGAGSKVTVDKTFGMKNKKGGKGQQAVKRIQAEQSQVGKSKEQLAKERQKELDKAAKLEAEKILREQAKELVIIQPKVPFGVDPKTVTCEFWKHNRCDKGSRCKYAHEDTSRRAQKKDLYTDTRELENEEKKKDTMDKWDQEKLDKVILSKHGNPKSTTDKVCKFFLQAVEDGKYGWFWECPNGGEKCMYRHRLPPGFVLRSQKKEMEAAEKANEISLEEFLEVERHKLGSNLTPVTKESFDKWKKERLEKKAAEEEAQKSKKAAQAAANKLNGLSGREMFTLNPDMYDDGEDDGDDEGEFDMSKYLQKGWEQDRQSDDEQGGVSSGEEDEEDEDDEEDEEDEAGDGAGVSGKMAALSVDAHPEGGDEEGRRKSVVAA